MGVKTNTITINGRTYDAVTGKPISDQAKPAAALDRKKHNHSPSDNKSKSRATAPSNAKTKRSLGPPAPLHRTQKSKTLMRQAVKKPAHPVRSISVSGLASQPKHIVVNPDGSTRKKHQTTHAKSPQITKFALSHSVKTRTAAIPVVPAPHHTAPHHTAPHHTESKHAKPEIRHSYDISTTPPAPVVKKDSVPLKELHKDLFETALQGSKSHTASKHHSHRTTRKQRYVRIGASALAVFLLLAFAAYRNAPSIALKRASGIIGFSARIPGYRPSGFSSAGPIRYEPGNVTINYRSNSDDRAYTVSQSEAKVNDSVLGLHLESGNEYREIKVKGTTGYTYNGSNLTWVKDGVLYTIEGDSQLSTEQLVKIANSL